MKVVIAAILLLVFLFSCATEPKDIVYEFKIVNDTDSGFVIKKHFKGSRNVFKADTLVAGSDMVLVVPRVGSYGESFGEMLIPSFFDTLLVMTLDSKKTINVGKRSYWKETAELDDNFLEKPGSMKGKVTYTLKMGSIVN
jgi:hypothetical protein